jgi:hypothetical protein
MVAALLPAAVAAFDAATLPNASLNDPAAPGGLSFSIITTKHVTLWRQVEHTQHAWLPAAASQQPKHV